ncbi:MAG: HAMP domain-containing sensor histidine kinase [Gaiellaceae bacterium]
MASFSLSGRALPALTGRIRAAPRAWSFIAAGAVAIAIYFLLPANTQSVYYVVVGFISVSAIYVGTRQNLPRGSRLAWHLFALGLLCQVAGDAIFAVYEVQLDREPPSPSIADAFYLGGYPLLALGVFLVLRRLGGQTSRAAVLDSVVIFSGVALAQWIFFIDPYNHQHFGTETARLVSMAYPAVDVLLLVAFAQLIVGPGGRTLAYRLLLVSVALWVVADEIYGLNNLTYQGGDWIDALWLGSYVVWGAAALDPSMARIAEPDRRRLPRLTNTRLTLLAAALLTAPAILLIERISHHRVHSYALGFGGAALSIVVLMRLSGLVRAVERARRSERLARREAEQAQQLLAYQNEQLLELDTLKDEFVSNVSHELRTPLTSISGYVELMLEDERDAEKRSYLEIVDRNAERLLGLVSDLLFSARLQGGRLELDRTEVDLHQLVVQAIESARPRAETAGVELTAMTATVPIVSGEAVRLAQLVDNLVSNAIKFTPPGGRVAVRLSSGEGLVRFEVSDTGIGITEQERERLFERFFRSQNALERQIQGTGLGLYISKAIVEAHGGRIGVDSKAGEGTTFVVELPVAA